MAKTAYIFPGQGAQAVGMGLDLYQNHPAGRVIYDLADKTLGFKISSLCFEGPADELTRTRNVQPTLLTTSMAFLKAAEEAGNLPPADFIAGHSLGEYSALVASGALKFADAVRIVRKRGTFMQEAVPVGVGGMAAILGMDTEVVEKVCEESAQGEFVSPANYNCPGQIVISGHINAVKRAAEKAEAEGAKRAVMLPVSAPFHSTLMQPAAERLLTEALNPVVVSDLSIPVLSNVEADFYPSKDKVKELLSRQVNHPVRWIEEMEKMMAEGVDRAFEIGPGKVLCGLMRKISRNVRMSNIDNTETLKEAVKSIE